MKQVNSDYQEENTEKQKQRSNKHRKGFIGSTDTQAQKQTH